METCEHHHPHWLRDDRIPALLAEFGSPLHVYHEPTLRSRLRELADLLSHRPWHPSISAKANSNPHLLALAREEGLCGDAMSPGEILLLEAAGFTADRILFVPNNVGAEELEFAASRGILSSLDSLDQVGAFADRGMFPKVALRIDPGIGDCHHAKVVTAGGGTKFGLLPSEIPAALEILRGAGIRLCGLTQHVGSGFLEPSRFLAAADVLLGIARSLPELEFVDFGGGFGIPYREGEPGLDLPGLGRELDERLSRWTLEQGRPLEARIEPGRYWCAEGGCLLGKVHAVKERGGIRIAGTDIGFNVLQRPVLYGAWHGVDLVESGAGPLRETGIVTWVGNICESGDILAAERPGPVPRAGDFLRVRDTGAYGASMGSEYNARPLPGEVLLDASGSARPIRHRRGPEDLPLAFPPSPSPRGTSLPDGLDGLRRRIRDLCLAPENRMGPDFYEEHVELVERYARRIAPLLGADLDVVVPAAILHDVAAIEDFSRVSEHHELGAVRAREILLEEGFAEPLALRVSECCRHHVFPVDPALHGPDAACLSHADALAQMANPPFWIHYAGKVRGLDFRAGIDWYRALLHDRTERMTESVKPVARPLLERGLDICRDRRSAP